MKTYLRHKIVKAPLPHPLGPKSECHPSVGVQCPACERRFVSGDYTTLIPLGPGDSEESRENAREGRWYNAVAIEVHYVCATGSEATLDRVHAQIGDECDS